MPDISKIQLPGSGGIYNIKDAVAREMISGGVSFIVAWDGSEQVAPVTEEIPEGVTVVYNTITYTGELDANDATPGAFYLVKSNTQIGGRDIYDEYVPVGTAGERVWEKIGDTQVDLSDVVTGVSLNKNTDYVLGEGTRFTANDSSVVFNNDGDKATVLGANTTFTGDASNVTFSEHTKDNVLGENTTFNTTVNPSLTYIGASTSTTSVVSDVDVVKDKKLQTTSIYGTNGTTQASLVSFTANANKLDTVTINKIVDNTSVTVPTVTGNIEQTANNSTWAFRMGTGDASETLIIDGGNGTSVKATLTSFGSTNVSSVTTESQSVAVGTISSSGNGADVLGGLSIQNKDVATRSSNATTIATGKIVDSDTYGDQVVSDVSVTSGATVVDGVTLQSGLSSGSGKIQVATGIASASTSAVTSGNNADIVEAITALGQGTAVGQNVRANTNDRHSVLKTIGTATAEGQSIEVGNEDKVNVLTNQTTISVTKGDQ